MKKIVVLIVFMVLCASILISCSSRNNDIPSIESTAISQKGPKSKTHTSNDVRDIKIPTELVGSPDRIYIVKGKQEKIFEPGTDEYNKIISLVFERFPETMKEAAMVIGWVDDGKFNWDRMSDEFDFLRLAYGATQTVKMSCMNANYKDLPVKEISFDDIIFPLTNGYNKVCIIGMKNTYGVLDNSSEIIKELLKYMDY